MYKYLILILFLINKTYCNNTKENKIIKIIDEQIELFKKTDLKSNYKDFRIFNLKIEKLKQVIIIENNELFTNKDLLKKEDYKKLSLTDLLKESGVLYNEIIAFINKNEIRLISKNYYSILAFNLAILARELKKQNDHELLLHNSLKHLNKNDPKLKIDIQIALAEHYYNTKNAHKSIWYYEKFINKYQDQWQLKHLHNYAWNLYKLDQKNKSIDLLKNGLNDFNKEKQIDLRNELLSSLILFMSSNQKGVEAFEYIKTYNYKPSVFYIKLLKYTKSQGRIEDFSLILNKIKNLNDQGISEEILIIEIAHYIESKQYMAYYDLLKDIYNQKIIPKNEELKKDINNILIDDFNLNLSKANNQESLDNKYIENIINNYNVLTLYNPNDSIKYHKTVGNIYFTKKKYSLALQYYDLAINTNLNKENSNDLKTSYDAIFNIIQKYKMDNKLKISYYKKYLENFPKESNSSNVAENIFHLYLANQNIDQMEFYFNLYLEVYSKNNRFKQEIFYPYVNYLFKYKEIKNLEKVFYKISNKKIKLSIKEKDAFEKEYYDTIFKFNENLILNGELEIARLNLNNIYINHYHHKKIRAIALINLSSTYVLKSNWMDFEKYFSKAMGLLKNEKISFFEAKYLKIKNIMYFHSNLKGITHLNLNILNFCKNKKCLTKDLILETIYYSYINNEKVRAYQILNKFNDYLKNQIITENINFQKLSTILILENEIDFFIKMNKNLGINKEIYLSSIYPSSQKRLADSIINNTKINLIDIEIMKEYSKNDYLKYQETIDLKKELIRIDSINVRPELINKAKQIHSNIDNKLNKTLQIDEQINLFLSTPRANYLNILILKNYSDLIVNFTKEIQSSMEQKETYLNYISELTYKNLEISKEIQNLINQNSSNANLKNLVSSKESSLNQLSLKPNAIIFSNIILKEK